MKLAMPCGAPVSPSITHTNSGSVEAARWSSQVLKSSKRQKDRTAGSEEQLAAHPGVTRQTAALRVARGRSFEPTPLPTRGVLSVVWPRSSRDSRTNGSNNQAQAVVFVLGSRGSRLRRR